MYENTIFFLQKFIKRILYHCVSFSKYDFHLILYMPLKKKTSKAQAKPGEKRYLRNVYNNMAKNTILPGFTKL